METQKYGFETVGEDRTHLKGKYRQELLSKLESMKNFRPQTEDS